MDDPKADILSYSDSDSDALFDTPAARKPAAKPHDDGPNTSKPPPKESQYTTSEDREAALRAELESVRNVNKVIEGVVASLQKAKSNMSVRPHSPFLPLLTILTSTPQTVSHTVHNATTLLQTWTRILSQTEHNQRLILSPQWQGATQDLLDIQEEESQRQQAAERRAAEDLARKEAAARKAFGDASKRPVVQSPAN